jgi:hypothetical protein
LGLKFQKNTKILIGMEMEMELELEMEMGLEISETREFLEFC